MRLSPGARLGHYTITAPLGEGGTGEVYRAFDTRLGGPVAIKIVARHHAVDPEAVARLEREGRMMAAVSDPHIVKLYDVGIAAGVPYVVTELLEGETLRELLARGPLPWRRAIEIGRDIASGLAAAHAKNIVHRDVRPKNVFVSAGGHAKILDFGLGRAAAPDAGVGLAATRHGAAAAGSSLAYMSPEQARGEAPGPSTDIFSLGCVLYEMLTGQSPFARDTAADTISALVRDDPPPLLPLTPGLPGELEALVKRCLHKQPEARFARAVDLAKALGAVSGGTPASAPLPDWLIGLVSADLSFPDSSVTASQEVTYAITTGSLMTEPMPAVLELTEDGVRIAEWPVMVPTERATVAIPSDLPPGTYEIALTRDNWELDAVPLVVETPADTERSKTYDSALSASERFMEAIRIGKLREAYEHARAAASAYTSLGSPATAARLFRESASALLSGGNSALAATAAFNALELYRDAGDPKSAQSAKHLLSRALLQVQALGSRSRGEIVGHSPKLLDVLRRIEQAARTNATTLIVGESGSGKALFAQAVHDRSNRSGPMVTLNCAAIPPAFVESELFGNASGAFTGASRPQAGRFELADGGTLFLDEIAELPLAIQPKLLRALQEGQFEPVGSNHTMKVNVRVIAATNRDLQKEVHHGRFREDLFYRLSTFVIEAPPLRQRRSDIPLLAECFMHRFSRELGKPIQRLHDHSLKMMLEYHWPGNVRELQNVIERAVLLATESVLELDTALLRPLGRDKGTFARNLHPSLHGVERDSILQALRRTQGVVSGKSGAARILGIHPNTLRMWMKKLSISVPSDLASEE